MKTHGGGHKSVGVKKSITRDVCGWPWRVFHVIYKYAWQITSPRYHWNRKLPLFANHCFFFRDCLRVPRGFFMYILVCSRAVIGHLVEHGTFARLGSITSSCSGKDQTRESGENRAYLRPWWVSREVCGTKHHHSGIATGRLGSLLIIGLFSFKVTLGLEKEFELCTLRLFKPSAYALDTFHISLH